MEDSMTRDQIIDTMLTKEPRRLWYPMQLGGNGRQLANMEAEGLIQSSSRYGGGHRQRDYYLTEQQHAAASERRNAETYRDRALAG
jgi:DNA-binding PadR family transcriptional regulator